MKLNMTIRYMIFTVFFLFSQTLFGQENIKRQKIDVIYEEKSLVEILEEWKLAYGLHLVYSNSELNDIVITKKIDESSYEKALIRLLENTSWEIKKSNLPLTFIIKKVKGNSKRSATAHYHVSGYIEDATSLEHLIGANLVEKTTYKGAVTNAYGFFSLKLKAGQHKLFASYVGYRKKKLNLVVNSDTSINVLLSPREQIKEIVVSAKRQNEIQNVSQMSMHNISMETVKSVPVFMGEEDVMKTIQLLPGVQSGNEGSSGLYIRGGGPDQNLVLLDGVPVYNSSHLFGFFSIFNADAINNTKLFKGGFPARYGGRLSSVVDIRMKEGNMKKLEGSASLGLISAKLSIEAPIVKDKTSFIFSGRRTYADMIMKAFSKKSSLLHFYDMNIKLNHKFSAKDRLYLSFYTGEDLIENTSSINSIGSILPEVSSMKIGWGNKIGALRWNHVFTPNLFSNSTFTYSQFNYDIENGINQLEANTKQETNLRYISTSLTKFQSGIEDITFKNDFDWIPSSNHYVKTGFGLVYHQFSPSVSSYNLTDPEIKIEEVPAEVEKVLESKIYIEDDIKIGRKLLLNAGIHYSAFHTDNKTYSSIEPRMSLCFKPWVADAIKISYSGMTQHLHLLSNSNVGIPIDLWVPATDKVKPQEATQIALGYNRKLNHFSFSVEAYYKTMKNLIEYKDNESIFGKGSNWDNKIEVGKGDSKGIEVFLKKTSGKTKGWIGYTWSKTNRKFDNINGGEFFPYKYDRRHDISLVLMHQLNKKWDIACNWVYGSGYTYTIGS